MDHNLKRFASAQIFPPIYLLLLINGVWNGQPLHANVLCKATDLAKVVHTPSVQRRRDVFGLLRLPLFFSVNDNVVVLWPWFCYFFVGDFGLV